MSILEGFSEPVELPNIPEGPGVAVLQDERGDVLCVTESENIRRRVGYHLDSGGTVASRGPDIYRLQQAGHRIVVRWKLTKDHHEEKKRLNRELNPLWARTR